MQRRLTMHFGRSGKNGVFSTRHNDRNFPTNFEGSHIDTTKSAANFIWHYAMNTHPHLTFDDAEKMFYEGMFEEFLNHRNVRRKKSRHTEQDMHWYRHSVQSCPEEMLVQIGDHQTSVPPQELWTCYLEYSSWHQRTFPQRVILDVALHMDEPAAAPHIHERAVWCARDPQKNFWYVSQNVALEQMGVQRPYPKKPESRSNNTKMTYTTQCRERFTAICRTHGISIISEPREASQSGRTLIQYKSQQEAEKLLTLQQEVAKASQELQRLHDEQTSYGQLERLFRETQDCIDTHKIYSTLAELFMAENPDCYQEFLQREALLHYYYPASETSSSHKLPTAEIDDFDPIL